MKKLLLVLFLFTLTSNALAKVEMWRCNYFEDINTLLKIDTSIPKVFTRYRGEWIPFNSPQTVFKYSKENNSISGYVDLHQEGELGFKLYTWDLITKELWFIDRNIVNPCIVIE